MPSQLSPQQQELIRTRVGLAMAIGHKAWKRLSGYDRDEIISNAFQGLVAAALRWPDYCAEKQYELGPFDEAAQSWFDTYASRRINGAIIDALRSSDPATRRERALIKEIIAAGVDLSTAWEHESAESIAARAKMDPADVKKAIAALVRMPVSLEENGDPMIADSSNVEEDAFSHAVCMKVVNVIRRMPDVHQHVVALAFYLGLSDEEIIPYLPEITEDVDAVAEAVQWVRMWREQASEMIKAAVTTEVSGSRV